MQDRQRHERVGDTQFVLDEGAKDQHGSDKSAIVRVAPQPTSGALTSV
jgi:hypothetical protein